MLHLLRRDGLQQDVAADAALQLPAAGAQVALIKPAVDTRAGQNVVFSRGLRADAELVIGPTHSIREQHCGWLLSAQRFSVSVC